MNLYRIKKEGVDIENSMHKKEQFREFDLEKC